MCVNNIEGAEACSMLACFGNDERKPIFHENLELKQKTVVAIRAKVVDEQIVLIGVILF
jgi:hypothetical protein